MTFDFESFSSRHIGPDTTERDAMLKVVGAASLDVLIDEAIPARIRLPRPLDLPPGESDYEFLSGMQMSPPPAAPAVASPVAAPRPDTKTLLHNAAIRSGLPP